MLSDGAQKITVYYSCTECGLQGVPCWVDIRQEEDVVQWMEGKCIPAIADNHHRRSPNCRAKKITEIKIPLTATEKVGGPTIS